MGRSAAWRRIVLGVKIFGACAGLAGLGLMLVRHTGFEDLLYLLGGVYILWVGILLFAIAEMIERRLPKT